MFVNMSPNFKKGTILKKEMLESLRDYPRNYVDIYFNSYSDGILFGSNVDIKDNNIIISKGCIKHRNRIYMLEKEYYLPYTYTNDEVIIKIKFLEEETNGDFVVYSTDIFLDKNLIINENELELGRFKLKDGARLRNDYQDFLDLSTEYNTLNILNVKHASYDNYTISPVIIKWFVKELKNKNSSNIYDVNFIMNAINEKVLTRDLITYYICSRLKIQFKEYTNFELYSLLCRILKESNYTTGAANVTRPNRVSKIIVD